MITAAVIALLTQLFGSPSQQTDLDGATTVSAEHPVPEILGWFGPSRVELQTPLGPLPFVIETGITAYSDEPSALNFAAEHYAAAHVRNGDHETITRSVEVHATGYIAQEHRRKARSFARIEFEEHQSVLSGSRGPSCVLGSPIADYMPRGTWTVTRNGFSEKVPFTSKRAKSLNDRFDPIHAAVPQADLGGVWLVRLEESDERATAWFTVEGNTVEAFMITPDGLLRDFGGRVDGDFLRLSYFDGRDAYLVHAKVQADGSLRGILSEGNWRQESWSAVRTGE